MDNRQLNRIGTSRFVPNTVALVIQTVVATLITLLQIKILANYLPKETFGLFVSFRGFSLLLATLAANGIPLLLVRFIPAHEANNTRREALRLAVASVFTATVLLVAVSLVAEIFRSWTWRFAGPSQPTFGLYFWFYATTLGVMLKMIVYGGLNGLRRLTTQVLLEIVSLTAVLAAIVFFRHELTLRLLFEILGSVHVVTAAVALAVFFVFLGEQTGGADGDRGRREGDARARDGLRRRYMTYYGGAVGLSLVALAFTDVDRYLLAQVISLEMLALFHVSARISRLANRVLGVANLAFQPEVTRLDAEGREASVVRPAWIFLKFNTTIAVLMTMGIVLFAREIITVVASARYVDAAPLLIILAVSLPLTTMTAPVTTVMKARDQVRGALVCDMSWTVIYVLLIFVLGPRIGLIGVGCAQLIACLAQLLLALRISRLPIDRRSVAGLALRLLVGAAAAFLPSILFDVFYNGGVLESAGIKLVLFVAGCVVFRWLIGVFRIFESDENAALNELLGRRRLTFIGRLIGIKRQ